MKNKKPTDFYYALKKFLSTYLVDERDVSSNTVESYRFTIKLFIQYLKKEKSLRADKIKLEHLTRQNVLGYLDWLESNRKCSESTRNLRLAGIRGFVSFLQYEDLSHALELQKILTIKNKRHDRTLVNYLETNGMQLLLQQPDQTTNKGIRELALMSLLYDSGARVGELIVLTPADLKINQSPMHVILKGKGRKVRTAALFPKQVEILRKYMKIYKLVGEDKSHYPLFSNVHGEPLTRAGVNYILQKNLNQARRSNPEIIPAKLTPHGLRHTKAMHMLESGIELVEIRDFLGHVSIQTTDIYARANKQAQAKALNNVYKDVLPETEKTERWHNHLDWLDDLMP